MCPRQAPPLSSWSLQSGGEYGHTVSWWVSHVVVEQRRQPLILFPSASPYPYFYLQGRRGIESKEADV